MFREAVKLSEGRSRGTVRERGKSRAYPFGIEAGLISVSGEPAGVDVLGLGDEELLRRWRDGVLGVCAAETPPYSDDGVLLLVLAVLEVLDVRSEKKGAWETDRKFWTEVQETIEGAATWYGLPVKHANRARKQYDASRLRGGGSPGLIELMKGIGLVSGDPKRPRITELGLLAQDLLPEDLPVSADPDLPAADLLALLAPYSCGETEDSRTFDRVAFRWAQARGVRPAARELVAAAEGLPAAARIAAGRLDYDVGQTTIVDYLAAALDRGDADEALSMAWEVFPGDDAEECLAELAATGLPDAEAVVNAVRSFLDSGAARTIDQALRLRVTVLGTSTETWRDVLVPAWATLDRVHDTICALSGRGTIPPWAADDEVPYWFTVGGRRYGESGGVAGLRKALDADQIRIRSALSQAERIGYVYDDVVCDEYEITLAEILPWEAGVQYPSCVDFAGDTPFQCPGPGGESEQFDIDEANGRLARYRDEFNKLRFSLDEPERW